MKQLCLIFAIGVLPTMGFSKYISDTVIVYVDNRAEMKITVSDFSDVKSSNAVIEIIKEFEALLPGIGDQLTPENPEILKYSSGNALTISPGDPKVIYLPKDGKMSNTGFRDQAILVGDNFHITITTNDISKISELPLSGCYQKVVAQFPNKIRWSKTLSYECIDGTVTELESKNNELDMLGFQFGAGGGLVKGRWVTDLAFGITLGLNYKGITSGPYVSSNMIFDFDAENNMHINTFLNLGYRWTPDKKSENPTLIGAEVGYLIVKQGDLFNDNTFRFSFNWSPVKHVMVSPQLYVTDNFKQAFPGIRVGFGF